MELQLRERSTDLIATLTNSEKSEAFQRMLTIEKIVDNAIPICVLKQTAEFIDIKRALDIQLTKFVKSLNLKWTISDDQIKPLVEDLLYKYPNETLEDFILVFRKARHGEFQDENGSHILYRLDSAVLFGFVNQHLEEKYKVVERKLMDEKDKQYTNFKKSDSDWMQLWKEAVEAGTEPETERRTSMLRFDLKRMTDQEIKEEGQEKPKHKPYPSSDENFLKEHREKIVKGRTLYFKEHYPEATEQQLQDYLNSFPEIV